MSEPTVTPDQLCEALQSALGRERAASAIGRAAEALGHSGPTFTRPQALEVLGKIAEVDGLVGISARFARSRLMTRWATDDLAKHRK